MPNVTSTPKAAEQGSAFQEYQLYYFSELLKRRICAGKITHKIGRATDFVFRNMEPYPEAVGILIDHGWGKPNEFIPWEKVSKIDDDAIFITPKEDGSAYPPFVDQVGWVLLNEHMMGRTIFDIDGRRTEVVNDVHLLASRGKMLLVHVDISFNGFLRKWGLGRLSWIKDQFISWRYVQPFSLEDTGAARDAVSLSITRKQIKELPGEDLADILEELSGKEQEAVFSTLDSEKAAEVLIEAEPRAQRQLIANLRKEKARMILSEMSVPQLAALFSVLPHDQMSAMMNLLPEDIRKRLNAILTEEESTAGALFSTDFVAFPKEAKVGDVLRNIRTTAREQDSISYIYVLGTEGQLVGVVDLRDLVLAQDDKPLGEMMVSPVVCIQEDDTHDDLGEMFAKYHFQMIPVVDQKDRVLGVIHYKDIMKGLITRPIV